MDSVVTALRFFFEHGVDTVLWPNDVASPLGYPCDLKRLPLGDAIRVEIDELATRYQSSLNWQDPMAPSPWATQEREVFNARSRALLERIRRELPAGWVVEDRFHPL